MTNSKKDRVGKTQVCMTDHVSPSTVIGGKESQSCFMPYIFLSASENANLQIKHDIQKIRLQVHIVN